MRTRVAVVIALGLVACVPVLVGDSGNVSALGKLRPTESRCFSVTGGTGGAAFVNLTPVEAGSAGDGQLVSSDVAAPPTASNVNFGPGTVDPNVAVAPIGSDGRVCYANSVHADVHLVADHLGSIATSAYTPATSSGAPDRRVDTRIGHGGTKVRPSGRLCFSVAGQPGDAALVNLTPVQAEGFGDGQLVSSDVRNDPPTASNVNFGPSTVDPNVAIATIGLDGEVCFINSVHTSVHLIADHLGTVDGDAYEPAQPSGAPSRRVDTRIGLGGVKARPAARKCFPVSGTPGDAAVVNLTPVEAGAFGDGKLVSSDVTSPPFVSNVNFGPGTVDPNVAVAPIGADGHVCFVNSLHTSVHLVADHLGTIAADSYMSASSGGSPVRKVDTRTETPPTTTAPATTTTTTPPSNCHHSYPTVCIPPAPPDLDCGDIPFRRFLVVPPDPHNFDADDDGVGCESG